MMAIRFWGLGIKRGPTRSYGPFSHKPDGDAPLGGGGGRRGLSAEEKVLAREVINHIKGSGGNLEVLKRNGLLLIEPKVLGGQGGREAFVYWLSKKLTAKAVRLLADYFEEEEPGKNNCDLFIKAGLEIEEAELQKLLAVDRKVILSVKTGRQIGNRERVVTICDEVCRDEPAFLSDWIEGLMAFYADREREVLYQASLNFDALWEHLAAAVPDLTKVDQRLVAACFKLGEKVLGRPCLELKNLPDSLARPVLEAALKNVRFLRVAHLCTIEEEVRVYERAISLTQASLIEALREEKETERREKLLDAFINLKTADAFDHMLPAGAFDPVKLLKVLKKEKIEISRELNHKIANFFYRHDPANIRQRLGFLLEGEQSFEVLPVKIAEVGGELAGVAHRALKSIRAVASRTRKPALTVYILSTAHGFNGERILDSFYKNPAARKRLLERIGGEPRLPYSARVKELEKLSGPARVDAEMRIIYQAFYEYVDHLQQEKGTDRLTAVMTVGSTWIRKGYLDYFTYPLELKIPSNPIIPIDTDTQEQLKMLAGKAKERGWDIILIDHSTVRTKEIVHPGDPPGFEKGRAIARGIEFLGSAVGVLAGKAKERGWDIILIDHSTVRTKGVVHRGDPPDFEKGRAIARGIEFLGNAVGALANPVWLYRENQWKVPDSLSYGRVNIVGLNLYDGKVYDQHFWGVRKEEWLPVDDHGKTMLGVEAEKGGVKRTDTVSFLEQNDQGYYQPVTVHALYWTAFRRELARLEDWPPTLPAFRYSSLLFVCNANHHRSPVFEILLRRLLRTQLGPDAEKVAVDSAGLEAEDYAANHPEKQEMSARARKMLSEQGIEVEHFPKTQLTKEKAGAADLILVMTEREKSALIAKFPCAEGKVKTVKEFLGYPEKDHDIPTPGQFTAETFSGFESFARQIMYKIYN